jgi:hypothetical protein
VVVLKCYLMSSICELYQHQIYREVRLHSSCNHENIINLFAAFQVRAAGAGARFVDDQQLGASQHCSQVVWTCKAPATWPPVHSAA